MNENKQCNWVAQPSYTEHDSFVVFKPDCIDKYHTVFKDEVRSLMVCPHCNKRITHLNSSK